VMPGVEHRQLKGLTIARRTRISRPDDASAS
jgi:hypothetical protein